MTSGKRPASWLLRVQQLIARIRTNSQKIKLQITWQQPQIRQDQLGMQMIHKDQLKCDTKNVCKPQGMLQAPRVHPAGHICKWGDRWLHWLDINFA